MCPTATLEKANLVASGEGIRDIVVQIDDAPGSDTCLAFAAAFARRHGAHLVALMVQLAPQMPGRVRAEVGELVLDAWRKHAAVRAQAMADTVAAVGRAEGIDIEFRAVEGLPEEMLMAHARHVDLTILGQASGDAAADQARTIEALLFGSGRPILLLPSVGTYKTELRHILCAWNASREATRALADAMPLLRRAEHVTVLSADPPGAAHRDAGADIALHLARHGVNVRTSPTYSGDLTVGDALLNRAADLGADLLVMGGYGHSRTREAIFGGATRHVLDHMTLPVLMSH